MKRWISIALVAVFAMGAFHSTQAQTKVKKTTAVEEPPVAKTWKESKEALNSMAAKFRDPKLTKEQKVALLPASNNLLYDTQQLKLTKAQKAEQIKVIVSFITATIDADFANSNTDSVYDDFKVNKKAYLAEIAKIKDKKIKDEILEAFEGWAEAEKDVKKAETEEDEGATIPEVQH